MPVCPDVPGLGHQPALSSAARRTGLPRSGGAPARWLVL